MTDNADTMQNDINEQSDDTAQTDKWRNMDLSNKERVTSWYDTHPEGTQSQCVQDTGIKKSTVSTYWPGKRRAKPTAKTVNQNQSAADDRMTIIMTAQHKRRLKTMAALDGISAAEWIAQRIDRDYPDYRL